MGVDVTSKIQLSINVLTKSETEVIEHKKFDEDTGEPYIKKESQTKRFFFIGDSDKPLNVEDFKKLIDELELTYDSETECLEQELINISDKGYDCATFTTEELNQAKTSLLINLIQKGISINDEEVTFELVHYLW